MNYLSISWFNHKNTFFNLFNTLLMENAPQSRSNLVKWHNFKYCWELLSDLWKSRSIWYKIKITNNDLDHGKDQDQLNDLDLLRANINDLIQLCMYATMMKIWSGSYQFRHTARPDWPRGKWYKKDAGSCPGTTVHSESQLQSHPRH